MKIRKLDFNIFQIVKKYGIAVLVTGAAILFYACESNNIAEIQTFSSPQDLPIQEAINFETTYTDSGQIRFTLKTPKLLRFENDGDDFVEFPVGMELFKYDSKKQIVSSIRADYAKQFVKDKRWEAKNNVVVTNIRGDSLKTEHLIWDEKNEEIHTEEFVKIIREDQIITGIGLVSDQDMLNWKIKNPKGVIYVSVNNQNNNEPTSSEDDTIPEKPTEIIPPLKNDKAIRLK